jgi:hypothetical protein
MFTTKIYAWVAYTRWLTCIILPLAFFFSNRIIFLSIHTALSLVVLLLCILSNKDRSKFPGLLLIISESLAFIWIAMSLLLVIDSRADFNFLGTALTKIFLWLQYICWVLNHIFELIIAGACLVPTKKLNEIPDHKLESASPNKDA